MWLNVFASGVSNPWNFRPAQYTPSCPRTGTVLFADRRDEADSLPLSLSLVLVLTLAMSGTSPSAIVFTRLLPTSRRPGRLGLSNGLCGRDWDGARKDAASETEGRASGEFKLLPLRRPVGSLTGISSRGFLTLMSTRPLSSSGVGRLVSLPGRGSVTRRAPKVSRMV